MSPENINGIGQDGAAPNPNQNTMNQTTTFSNQSLQPVQNPFIQNLPLQTLPPKSKRSILIAGIIGALVLIIAVVGIAYFVMIRNDENNNSAGGIIGNVANDSNENIAEEVGSSVAENTTFDVIDVVDVEKFKQMAKAEVMDLLKAGQGTVGSMPKNYVSKEIMNLVIVENNVVKSDVRLQYSHDTIDDLRQIAEGWYGVFGHNDGITEDDYEIKEYEYYAIVTPNRIEGANTCDTDYYGGCTSLLSFKSDYMNYYQEQTTPSSYNDVTYLNVQDPEIVERLMRVFSFFYNYGAASTHGNIYGSSFEERDDKFILTVYYVGIGLDTESFKVDGSSMSYAINLYSRQYAADKADGRLHVIRTGENSTIENIKSIPITQEEAISLLSR